MGHLQQFFDENSIKYAELEVMIIIILMFFLLRAILLLSSSALLLLLLLLLLSSLNISSIGWFVEDVKKTFGTF